MARQRKLLRKEPGPGKGRAARWRKAAYGAGVGAVWLAILAVLAFAVIAHDLPDLADLPPPGREAVTEVQAVNGATLARYGPIRGDWLDYAEVPEAMVLALLAVEDRRFFEHGGVDPFGVARAILANLRAGGMRQGGSTLTQQLAKNIFLSSERSFRRKARELLMALWLEREFSKEQILALYLNRVYFGAGNWGIDAASRTYFGHSARRLSLAEAAMLAGLVKAPSRLAPTRDLAAARARAGQVLDAMVDAGYLTEQAADRARAAPAVLAADAAGPNVRWFTDLALARADAVTGPRDGPATILTTLDPTVWHAAEAVLTARLDEEGVASRVGQGALVALARDGAVLAMAGGRSYGESQYNRAVQASRQPGSAFKPFVYLAGFEAGLAPDSVMEDAPIEIEGWSPGNFTPGFRGPVTLREAFVHSINTVAVRVGQHAGPQAVALLAERFGFAGPIQPLPSLALGSAGVSLLDLAAGYAALANGGAGVEPYLIVEIRGAGGEVLYRHRPESPQRVARPDHVADLVSMMVDVIERGTGRAARIDRPAAGKTGTSQDFRDAVFAGFTADMVAAVWVGNDDDTPTDRVTGGGLPARIWHDFMIDAHIGRPVRDLPLAAARR